MILGGAPGSIRVSSAFARRMAEHLGVVAMVLALTLVLPDPRVAPIVGLFWALGGVLLGYALLALPTFLRSIHIAVLFDAEVIIARRVFARQAYAAWSLVRVTLTAHRRGGAAALTDRIRAGGAAGSKTDPREPWLHLAFADGRSLVLRPMDLGESTNRLSEANRAVMEELFFRLRELYAGLGAGFVDELPGGTTGPAEEAV